MVGGSRLTRSGRDSTFHVDGHRLFPDEIDRLAGDEDANGRKEMESKSRDMVGGGSGGWKKREKIITSIMNDYANTFT